MSDFDSTPQSTCLDPWEADFIALDTALAQIKTAIKPLTAYEYRDLANSLNRILAKDIHAPFDVPRRTNAAMDGYAIHTGGKKLPREQSFRQIGRALAGQAFEGSVAKGECVRITTGAWLPTGADTIIIQERCHIVGEQINYLDAIEPGQNIRHAGEDLRSGEIVLSKGARLMPAELGLLASIGSYEIPVIIPPRIAYFSTGDEIRRSGDALDIGEIFDSNRHTVAGILQNMGLSVADLGCAKDQADKLRKIFARAFADYDLIISSGGVSVSEADYVKPILAEFGQTHFWKVAVRPGRPFTFGSFGEKLFFGLPGNPVAVMVMMHQLVQPALRYWLGELPTEPLLIKALCQSHLRKRPGRTEFQRGTYRRAPEGHYLVEKTGNQGSGILSSMSKANCFIVLPPEIDTIASGDWVDIQPFCSLR